jgi:hypothetical protein
MSGVASLMLTAFRDHAVDCKTYPRWDTRGGRWRNGLPDAVMAHTTATASATGSRGCPTLPWAAHTYDWAISNFIIGRGPGDSYFLSANPSYHSGDGGPWPALGINSAANVAHLSCFGIEIDDPGRGLTLTDYQIETTARVMAALWDLGGWPGPERIVTHQAWTDGSYGVNPGGPSPYLGRKGDTLHKNWAEYPGSTRVENYNPLFWRRETVQYLAAPTPQRMWDGTVPSRAAVKRAEAGELNYAGWRVAARLHDLGFRDALKPRGAQPYPVGAVRRFQAAQGWENAHGSMSQRTQRRLFGKVKP